jgi:hypothetical protein
MEKEVDAVLHRTDCQVPVRVVTNAYSYMLKYYAIVT